MRIKKSRELLITLSLVLTAGSFAPMVYAATDSDVTNAAESESVESKSKINRFLEKKRELRAKEIIESTSESSPLTLENKEEIVEYYADKYMPIEGCSLLELPADSDIDYVPPKPKVEKKTEPKVKVAKKANSLQPTTQKTPTKVKSAPKQVTSHNGKAISMSSEDRNWLEKLVEAEATGESYEGKVAVATVIANRVESSAFPNSVIGVIKAQHKGKHQFSPWDDGRIHEMNPTSSTKQAVAAVFDNGTRSLPKETTYFAVKSIAFDNWMGKTRKHITTIGNHAFFSQYAK